MVENFETLTHLPLWPLYFLLRNGTARDIALALPKLDSKQREFIFDLDLWKKQDFDLENYEKWIEILYISQNEEIIKEFTQHPHFLVYLRGRLNIYTHNIEHPVYPNSDDFFITDDFCYLVEYDKDYKLAEELKFFLTVFYSARGVEAAQALLMEVVNESFFQLQENAYKVKKSRLDETGYVDFYDALENKKILKIKEIETFILSKFTKKYLLTVEEKLGTDIRVLETSRDGNDIHNEIRNEISKIENEKIINFLPTDYIRTINANFVLNESFQKIEGELQADSEKVQSFITLGFDYIITNYTEKLSTDSLFEFFSFKDLEHIGRSLVLGQIHKMKTVLKNFDFSHDDDFLGDFFKIFLQDIFELDVKFKYKDVLQLISNVKIYKVFYQKSQLLIDLSALMKQFKNEISNYKEITYLNYRFEDLDFEGLFLTRYIKHCLGLDNKLSYGMEINEFKKYIKEKNPSKENHIKDFIQEFELDIIENLEMYLSELCIDHFSHLEKDDLAEEDYKFVSGVLLTSAE